MKKIKVFNFVEQRSVFIKLFKMSAGSQMGIVGLYFYLYFYETHSISLIYPPASERISSDAKCLSQTRRR